MGLPGPLSKVVASQHDESCAKDKSKHWQKQNNFTFLCRLSGVEVSSECMSNVHVDDDRKNPKSAATAALKKSTTSTCC